VVSIVAPTRSISTDHIIGCHSGRALMKSAAGDSVVLQAREARIPDVLEVRYVRISVEPFREPPASEASEKDSSPTSLDEEETMRQRW